MTNVWQCVKRLNGNQLVMAAIPCHTISRIKWLHKLHWMPNKNEIERYQKRARFSWIFDGVTETAGMRIEKLRKQQQQKAHTHSLHIKFYLFLLLVTLYQTCYESYLVEYCPSHSHHGRVNVLWLHRSLSLSRFHDIFEYACYECANVHTSSESVAIERSKKEIQHTKQWLCAVRAYECIAWPDHWRYTPPTRHFSSVGWDDALSQQMNDVGSLLHRSAKRIEHPQTTKKTTTTTTTTTMTIS